MIGPALDHARHQAAQSWEIPAAPTLPPTRFLPSILSGRMIARGKSLPSPHPLIFRPYICFSLHKHYFIGPFEKHTHKKKYKQNNIPYRTSITANPAKRDVGRMNYERDMLDFRPGLKRSPQLTARIDGIDRDFLFGNKRL